MNNRDIVVAHLVKRYGDFYAVNDVSFQVSGGEIFGFLGPNGAGKSTTVRMLTTLSIPTSGKALVGGYDITHQAELIRRISGVALQEIGLDPLMTSTELLMIQCQLFGMNKVQAKRRTDELLELVKLSEFTSRPTGKYSGGMRRRLDLALSLAHEPNILFLDEPTTGLDPASRRDIWHEVRRLNRDRGITIFLTTQYLEEADELADRIAIINDGKIAIEGKPEDLKAALGTESINIMFEDSDTVERAKDQVLDLVQRVQIDRRVLRLYLPQSAKAVPVVMSRLEQHGIRPLSLTLSQPTLDDVFLQVTGQRFEEETEEVA